MTAVKVLCVDDEPHVLEGLAINLRRGYEMTPALSGEAGLKALKDKGPFAVVLSDMRMPGMDGAAFLAHVRELAPDTTRMLLTGHADLQAAIAAVNEGQVFRFLTKPCPSDHLRLAFDAAAEQYRLVTSERVLLEQTLHGAVKTLTDILSLASPVAFGRAVRIREHVRELAAELKLPNSWQVEVAAMLSQLGSITIPDETIAKYYQGGELSTEERAMIARLPTVTDGLLANIPRLEPVREILARHVAPVQRGSVGPGSKPGRDDAGAAASVLRVAVEFDELESRGVATQTALDALRGRKGAHDPETLDIFAWLKGAEVARQEVREIPLRALRLGMILAEDMHAKNGLLLVTRGFEVTPSFLEKTRNYREGYVSEPLLVTVRVPRPDPSPG
jgi:response regulator RpfG family c-di-GMP phosphodiesterase